MAEKRPTTTISTIAIKAGDTTNIVLAVLKSTNWVHLRIDKMNPSMLDVGRNTKESTELLRIHQDLIDRLKSKQENIEELLSQADRLVTEQQEPEVAVYEAMADSLGSAWKDLNRQLQLRGNLLEEAVRFYSYVDKHDELLARVDRQFSLGAPQLDSPEAAQRLFNDLDRMRKEFIDVTALAMECGQSSIAQIRVLGPMADNPERPRETADASAYIEEVMLRLVDQWKRVEIHWEEYHGRLEVSMQSSALWGELKKIDNWFEANDVQFKNSDLGTSEHSSSLILGQVEKLQSEAKQYQSILRRVTQTVERLGHEESGQLMHECTHLKDKFEVLLRHLETRRHLLQDCMNFFRTADNAITQLRSLQNELSSLEPSRVSDLEDRAKRLTNPSISLGQSLLQRVSRDDPGARGVSSKVSELQQALSAFEQQCLSRGREVLESFEREFRRIHTWLIDVGEAFLRTHRDLGTTLPAATDFIHKHTTFAGDLTTKESDVLTLLNRAKTVGDSSANRPLTEFHQRWDRLRQIVEQRVQLANTYQQFHKLAAEVAATLDTLEALLKVSPDESNRRQIEELWTNLNQTFARVKHQGDKFNTDARKHMTRDPDLDVDRAQLCVQTLIEHFEDRKNQLNRQWTQISAAQHEFKNIERMIEEIEIWVTEITEIVRDIERQSETCRTSGDANHLIRKLEPYKRQKDQTDHKLVQVEQTARSVHYEDSEHKLQTVKKRYTDIVDRMFKLHAHLSSLVETFTAKELQEKQKPPKFTQQLRDAQVDEGNAFEFTCRVVADPEPTISWFKDGVSVAKNTDYQTSLFNGVCALRIEETFAEDSAVYMCRAENPAGVAQSEARLTVKAKAPPIDIEANRPKFVKQLKNLTVTEGTQVRLDCTVVGTPEPEVIWFKEDQPIRESERMRLLFEGDRCSVILQSAALQDAGLYKCTARNNLGEISCFCRLIVQPAIKPMGPPPPMVPLQQAPAFSPALHNQTLALGQRCMFETRVIGEPAPQVKWSFEDKPIFSSANVQVLSDSSGWHRLVIDRTSQEHAGIYSVQALNPAGEAKSMATLNVTRAISPRGAKSETTITEELNVTETHLGLSPSATAPEFVRPFSNEYRLPLGSRAKLECLLVGSPRPKASWYFNGKPIVPSSGFCQLSNVGDAYSIIINKVLPEHQGTYVLKAENIRGQTECTTRVVVTSTEMSEGSLQQAQSWRTQQLQKAMTPPAQPPHFSQTLVSVVCTEGEDARFEGVVSGLPPPEVTWQKDGRPFTKAANPEVRFSSVGGKVSLVFPNASSRFAGKYTCTATNTAGVATSSAQLVVRGKTTAPDFVQRLISREVAEGESVRWTIKVTGDPLPNITWLRNGASIPNCQDVQCIDEGGGRYTLYIVRAEMADAGQFTVLAENVAGEARSTADLVVRQGGAEPGQYFHVQKVTQAHHSRGREVNRNEAFTVEQPVEPKVPRY